MDKLKERSETSKTDRINRITKKTNKTPPGEIEHAKAKMKDHIERFGE